MENDYCIKCPTCLGLKCRSLTKIRNDTIDVCTFYTDMYNCSPACIFTCRTCKGKGYLNWIDSLFHEKEFADVHRYFKRDVELLENKDYYFWISNGKDLSKSEIEKLYKDFYGE